MVKTHWLPVRTSLRVTEGCKNQSKTYGSFKDTCATRSCIVAEEDTRTLKEEPSEVSVPL